jgi:carboxyl-terminal processing protease
MTEKTKKGAETVYTSKEGSAGIEYVVLVNGDTASASEILTAAIQDNNGGKVIGSKTYGKGVTQSVHKFRDDSAIKITVTEYFRPNGGRVNDIGITPDIEATEGEAMDKALEELAK